MLPDRAMQREALAEEAVGQGISLLSVIEHTRYKYGTGCFS